MKGVEFSKSFFFTRYTYRRYHHTNASSGANRHFFGILEKGHCRIVSADRSIEAGPGELFYIPLGLPYQSYWFSEDEVVLRSYGFDGFPEEQEGNYTLQVLPAELAVLLEGVALRGRPDSSSLGALFIAIGKILPHMERSDKQRTRCIWMDAVAYLQENPEATAGDMARHCGVSESALYTAFKRHGSTPNQTRQKLLVKQAKQLLTTTDSSVQTISDQLGFSSSSYFRKILRRYTGKTPMQIRKAGAKV